MSRSKNILVVVMAIFVVLSAGIIHVVVILGGIGEAPAEWKDYFVLNGIRYFNSYNIIDSSYSDAVIGKIKATVPRGGDVSSYTAGEAEAVYLPVGTLIYSIKGYDTDNYVAALDNGEFCLYCADDRSPAQVVRECGIKTLRKELEFKRFFIDTVCEENSDYDVRISVVKNRKSLLSYLDRYVNDFRDKSDNFTYSSLFEDRDYNNAFFRDRCLIILRLPEDDGEILYDLDSIFTDDEKMTVLLTENCLPARVSYDKCTVRHMLIELKSSDYSDQTISYQIERVYHHLKRFENGVEYVMDNTGENEPQNSYIFSIINSRTEAVGTIFESLVRAEYDKTFFESNRLLILYSPDNDSPYEYSYEGITTRKGIVYVNLTRRPIADDASSGPFYFVIPIATGKYDGMVYLPYITVLNDAIDEADVPGNIKQRDVLVVDDMNTFRDLSDVYSIAPGLYNETFFDDYVLFFAGYLTLSSEIEISYSSLERTDNSFLIKAVETIPEEIDLSPTFKYIAVPFLRSDYKGEPLRAEFVEELNDESEDTLESMMFQQVN